jgi:hypothetical protein
METYIFKTNFKCQSCIAQVQPLLDSRQEIQWEIKENNDGVKILIISGDDLDIHTVIEPIKNMGYTLEWEP